LLQGQIDFLIGQCATATFFQKIINLFFGWTLIGWVVCLGLGG